MEGLDYVRHRVSWTDIKGGGPTIAIIGRRNLPRLDDLISGLDHGLPYSDNLIPTIKELRRNILGPEISHNHANIIRLEGLQRRQEHKAYRQNKPCAGCGDETEKIAPTGASAVTIATG